jgi:hypothetical protein
MSIRVSQEHGVNPSLGLCFYCRKAKEVVLLGAMSPQRREKLFGPGHESYSDTPYSAEAPREAVYNMEPCDECTNWMKQGVILISYDPAKTEEGARDPWRTGGWVVLRDEAISRVLDGNIRDQILEKRFSFVEDEVWNKLGLPRGAADGEEDAPRGP